MAKLTKKERDALPDSAFALPGRRYPMIDKGHAQAALSRIGYALKMGHVTKSEHDIVVAKARKILEEDKKSEKPVKKNHNSYWDTKFYNI